MGFRDYMMRQRVRFASYSALLVMLVGWELIFPIFDKGGAGSHVVGEIIFAAVLLAAVAVAAEKPNQMRILSVLLILAVGGGILDYMGIERAPEFRFAVDIVRIIFLIFTVHVILRHLLRPDHEVTLDDILGAICVYLLLAAVFAVAYRATLLLDPDAILFAGNILEESPYTRTVSSDLSYYSFVTLTTLGYGDIVPVSPMAKTLSSIEAMAGQLYLALVLAWLVGMHMSSWQRKHRE